MSSKNVGKISDFADRFMKAAQQAAAPNTAAAPTATTAADPSKTEALKQADAVYQIIGAAFKDAGIDPSSGVMSGVGSDAASAFVVAMGRYMQSFQTSVAALNTVMAKVGQAQKPAGK